MSFAKPIPRRRDATRALIFAWALLVLASLFTTARDAIAQGAAPAPPPAGTVFRDCADCPEMVVIPPGGFLMGSPASEEGRFDDEGPQRTVTIGHTFAAGKFEVTRNQYAAFATETRRPALPNCWYWSGAQSKYVNDDPSKNWNRPGFAQAGDHPVVCVTWDDAQAYVQWLSRKTGKDYRLLTEAEWEYAARAYSRTARPWGDSANQACAHANVADQALLRAVSPGEGKKWNFIHDCDDGSAYTSAVGRYQANRFGLYDMIGNALEWVEDCWNTSFKGAPEDGSAWTAGECARRVVRGGSWSGNPRLVRSAERGGVGTAGRGGNVGFRLARTL